MAKLKERLLFYYKFVRHHFPSPLPKGMQDFDKFCDEIISVHALPDHPSYRHAVATGIMHLGPLTSSKSKAFFAKTIKKAMANQVAFEQIKRLKKLEDEYIKQHAPEEAKPEATSETVVGGKM